MRGVVFGLLLVAVCAPVLAVNKCTDPATGAVAYSDGPCAKGETNKAMPIEAVPGGARRSAGVDGRAVDGRQPNAAVEGPREAYQLLTLYRRWIDAEQLASSTPRVALAERVDALQEIKRTTAALIVPPCLERAQIALTRLAAQSADGYMSFLGRQETGTMVYVWLERKPSIEAFERAVRAAVCPSDMEPAQSAR